MTKNTSSHLCSVKYNFKTQKLGILDCVKVQKMLHKAAFQEYVWEDKTIKYSNEVFNEVDDSMSVCSSATSISSGNPGSINSFHSIKFSYNFYINKKFSSDHPHHFAFEKLYSLDSIAT